MTFRKSFFSPGGAMLKRCLPLFAFSTLVLHLLAVSLCCNLADADIALTNDEKAWLQEHPVIRVASDPGWAPVEFQEHFVQNLQPMVKAAQFFNTYMDEAVVIREILGNDPAENWVGGL